MSLQPPKDGARGGAQVRYGPAGWDYRDWEGVVFPRRVRGQKLDRLTYLASYFDALEINSTFYRPATASSAATWASRVASNRRFKFTVKLWRRLTHERDEAFTPREVELVTAPLAELARAERLGAVIAQFPWSFRNGPDEREWLHRVLESLERFPVAVEVRHASWDLPETYELLRRAGAGFVNIDQPLFHDSLAPSSRRTARLGYVRVHGRNYQDWFRKDAGPAERYDYLYRAEELLPWARTIEELAAEPEVDELYVITNNHFRGKAPTNALMLQAMVEGRTVPAPPGLLQTYRDVLQPYASPEEHAAVASARPSSAQGTLFD